MTDKNGIEIKTGDIVEITGAYFKNDNGLYFVANSPGDPSWNGSGHCLQKISKSGKLSTAKRNLCFWPIRVFVSSYDKRVAAREWNAAHATIERASVKNMAEVVAYFRDEATRVTKITDRMAWDFGEDSEVIQLNRAMAQHYEAVAQYVEEEF